MAIEVNKSTNRVDPPTIVLNGQLVDTTSGVYATVADQTITTQEVTIESSTSVRKREVLSFQGDVSVTLTPDTDYTANSYSNRSASDFIGATAVSSNEVASKSETYYTVNGKDPSRTKSNLYTGSFTIRRNLSGHDNTILKTRTYVNGKASSVRTVEIRIVRANTNLV
jgi:hypothetical protein